MQEAWDGLNGPVTSNVPGAMGAHHRNNRGGRARLPSYIERSNGPGRTSDHASARWVFAVVTAIALLAALGVLAPTLTFLGGVLVCVAALVSARSAHLQGRANLQIARTAKQTAELQRGTAELELEAARLQLDRDAATRGPTARTSRRLGSS